MGLFGRMVVGVLPIVPRFFVGWIAKRYIAGKDLDSAVELMRRMQEQEGACFTVDVLGEEITDISEAQGFLEEYERVLDRITEHQLDAHLSVKPTAFGVLIDEHQASVNLERLLRKAAEQDIFIRLDMEDRRVTQATIDICVRMHELGLTNVGVVLQARLLRTPADITAITEKLGPAADFRICKGIYLEPPEVAHTGYREVVDAMNDCVEAMLDSGAYVGIATHDHPVIKHSLDALTARGMGPDIPDPRKGAAPERVGKGPGYEFQMLLGVRGNVRRRLKSRGHKTRVYLPYGDRWYEYSIRRLRENPDVAAHIARAFLMPWTNRR